MGRGVIKVLKNGLFPAASFGSKCVGVSDAHLKTMRKALCSCLPGGQGSTSLKLALANLEPTMEVSGAPVVAWAMAVWNESVDLDMMQRAWRNKVSLSLSPKWCSVQGPASATCLSLQRAHWAWPAWHCFLTRERLLIDLKHVCPMDVADMFHRDAEAVLWADWTMQQQYSSLAPGPLVRPLYDLVSRKASQGWTAQHANVARKVITTGELRPKQILNLVEEPKSSK